MTAVCLLDTSVLCELLAVPGHSQSPGRFQDELQTKTANGESLLLPFPALLETGNHIGQIGDGNRRRQLADKLIAWLRDAIDHRAPFVVCRMPTVPDLAVVADAFPEWAQRHASGLGDLLIQREWLRQCQANRKRRIYVWSKDGHLARLSRD